MGKKNILAMELMITLAIRSSKCNCLDNVTEIFILILLKKSLGLQLKREEP